MVRASSCLLYTSHVDLPAIEILEIKFPVVKFRVECSKGTYIRSLCADIGEKLCCGGTMQSLVRTRVGEFQLADALTPVSYTHLDVYKRQH